MENDAATSFKHRVVDDMKMLKSAFVRLGYDQL